jgi:nitrite reductase (NADH) large subunit
MIALAAILLPSWPYSPSVEAGTGIDHLWIDGTWKQVTGFTLVGLSTLIALLSLRKRIGWNWLGSYRGWRILHAIVGVLALLALFLHTGFHLGSNLNRWLMLTFLAVAVAGSITGIVTAREHRTLARGRPSRRAAITLLHILTFWPLPLLLLLHVVTVYAY